MLKEITAQQIIERIRTKSGSNWIERSTDMFLAGDPSTVITGIATSYTPSIEVLKKAVATSKNLIITQQPAYYSQTETYLAGDPAYRYKKDYIEKNKLVLWRYYDNWNNRETDGQLKGLAKALDWDKYYIYTPGIPIYERRNKYFKFPASTLRDIIIHIKNKLNISALRIIGDPDTQVTKAALSNDMFKLSELQEFLQDPEINLILIAEAIEWEACEYFRDILTWKGRNKAMVLIGREAAEDPGYGEMASWLSGLIKEVPIDWIPAGEPFWIP